jgi:hypothetical protein
MNNQRKILADAESAVGCSVNGRFSTLARRVFSYLEKNNRSIFDEAKLILEKKSELTAQERSAVLYSVAVIAREEMKAKEKRKMQRGPEAENGGE